MDSSDQAARNLGWGLAAGLCSSVATVLLFFVSLYVAAPIDRALGWPLGRSGGGSWIFPRTGDLEQLLMVAFAALGLFGGAVLLRAVRRRPLHLGRAVLGALAGGVLAAIALVLVDNAIVAAFAVPLCAGIAAEL